MTLRIGTSGWSYPTGRGTWNGLFYPAGRSKRAGTAGFDELRFYAEHFDTVEVNSTFYGQPRPEVTRGWAERTPPGFEFSVKLYQKFTHPKMFRERGAEGGAGLRRATLLDLLAQVTQSDIDEFRAGIEPLASAGQAGRAAGAVSRQLQGLAAVARLSRRRCSARSPTTRWPWSCATRAGATQLADTLSLLNAHDAAFVQIDEPKFRFSIEQNYLPNVTSFYYMRLHGRNAANWWRHETTEDRYDYLYSAEELREFSDIAGAAQALVRKSYLYTNNHFAVEVGGERGDAEGAARRSRSTGEYPDTLIEHYPEIRALVRRLGLGGLRAAAAVLTSGWSDYAP